METLSVARIKALAIATATVIALCTGIASPTFSAPSENAVKAAYLFNFARYVKWPADTFDTAADPIRICVVGNNSFLRVLKATVAEKQVGDRPVSAESRADGGRSRGCHILFLEAALSAAEPGAKKHGVFTVSDRAGFAASGGVANFVRVDSKVRFEINTDAAEKAGLQVSSRLLRLARIIE